MTFRVRIATRSAFLLALLLAAPHESRAQVADSARIAVGTRVWVRMRDGTQGEWRFERTSPDSLTLRRHVHGGDVLRSVPWSEAERVDTMAVGLPSGGRMFRGAAAGGLVGVMVVGVGVVASGPCHWDAGSCPGFGWAILAPEIVFTGIFTGAYLGLRKRDWHWSTAWRAADAPARRDR